MGRVLSGVGGSASSFSASPSANPVGRRKRAKTHRLSRQGSRVAVVITGVVACAAVPGMAPAPSGGSSPANPGGTAYVATPQIKAVKCLAACMSGGRVKNGGKLKLRGADLEGVTKVKFLGAAGRGDDVSVKVSATNRSVPVPVPFAAQSGRLAAYAG